MQVSFSASGTPSQVRDAINQQAKAAQSTSREAWPAAAAVRDYVAQQLAGLADDRTVSVSASISVTLTGAEKPEPAGKITTVDTGTVGVPGKAVGIVGEDRVIATDPAPHASSGDAVAVADERPVTTVAPHTGQRRASDRT